MEEWRYIYPSFLTSALGREEWSFSRPGCFTPGERSPSKLWIRGWVGPTPGLDVTEKRKIYFPGRPARNPSLYRRSYPGSPIEISVGSNKILQENLQRKKETRKQRKEKRKKELCK
jgi:hypothetical protein